MIKYPLKKVGDYCYSLSQKPIGQTAKSVVYAGFHIVSQKQVAIKVIKLSSIKRKQERKMVEDQIQILFQLRQLPNIVTIYDAYQSQNHMYIVMGRYHDGDLEMLLPTLIQENSREEQSMLIMDQILNGYQQIYNHRILHRDLKLANIFINHKDIVVADFGYAIKANINNKDGLIKAKENVGSPLYMPPQALQKSMYSYKSDIWSLGIIYYQILFGITPWIAESQEDLIVNLKKNKIQNLLPQQLTSKSKQFLLRTLCFQYRDRMDANELIQFRFFDTKDDKSTVISKNKINTQKMWDNKNDNISQKFGKSTDQHTTCKLKQIKDYISEDIEPLTKTKSNLNNLYSPQNEAPKLSFNQALSCANDTQSQHTAKFPLQNFKQNFKSINKIKKQKTFIVDTNSIKDLKKNDHNKSQNNPDLVNKSKINKITLTHIHMKQLSNQLTSQIHFCRYLYKIHQRILQLQNINNHKLLEIIRIYVLKKCKQILYLQGLQNQIANTYKKSSTKQFQKIQKIAKKYYQKYLNLQCWYRNINIPQYQSFNKILQNNCQEILLIQLGQWINFIDKSENMKINKNEQYWGTIKRYSLLIKEVLTLVSDYVANDQLKDWRKDLRHIHRVRQYRQINQKIGMLRYYDQFLQKYEIKQTN